MRYRGARGYDQSRPISTTEGDEARWDDALEKSDDRQRTRPTRLRGKWRN